MDHISKCKGKFIKLEYKKIGRNLHDMGLGNDLLDSKPKAWYVKGKDGKKKMPVEQTDVS